jgi:hypothetical protein
MVSANSAISASPGSAKGDDALEVPQDVRGAAQQEVPEVAAVEHRLHQARPAHRPACCCPVRQPVVPGDRRPVGKVHGVRVTEHRPVGRLPGGQREGVGVAQVQALRAARGRRGGDGLDRHRQVDVDQADAAELEGPIGGPEVDGGS